MGRSAATVNDAEVIYFDYTDYDEYDWQDMIDNVSNDLRKKYLSLLNADKWIDRENHIILENNHIQISVSEYCGCGAFSIFVRPDIENYWPYNGNLARHWLEQNITGIKKIIAQYVHCLKRIGTFSNGEAVYEAV